MRNPIKARITAGDTVAAIWVETGSAEAAEAVVHAGWDVVVIDCEHGPAGLEDAPNLARAVQAAGGETVLRVPDLAEATFKRALDRGARSIMAPMVDSAETARRIASYCLYPPRGRRGYAAPIVRASGYGARADYAATAHEELLLIAQIEQTAAIDEIEAIAAVPGIDMLFIGPNDLSGSMGRLERLTDPEVLAKIAEIERRTLAAGALLGTITGPGRGYAELKALGHSLIAGPSDMGLLVQAARAAAAERDRALG